MSRGTAVARLTLGAGGLVVVGAGAVSLLGTTLPALVSLVVLLAVGVIAHDAVIAPATVVGGVAARRLLPRPSLAPLVVAAVLLGTLTAVALPVLVGTNESPDNATVVDRPYRATWLVLAAATAVAVVVAGRLRSARHRSEGGPASAPGAVGAGAPAGSSSPSRRAAHPAPLRLVPTVAVVVVSALRAVRPRRGRPPGRGS